MRAAGQWLCTAYILIVVCKATFATRLHPHMPEVQPRPYPERRRGDEFSHAALHDSFVFNNYSVYKRPRNYLLHKRVLFLQLAGYAFALNWHRHQ
jgi:hypothetical protein